MAEEYDFENRSEQDVLLSFTANKGHRTRQANKIDNLLTLQDIWSEWRLTVIAATVRIALVDILDLSEVDIPAGVFLHPAVGWGCGW